MKRASVDAIFLTWPQHKSFVFSPGSSDGGAGGNLHPGHDGAGPPGLAKQGTQGQHPEEG